MTSQVQDTSSTAALAADRVAPLLELKEITKSFPNRIHILGPISLVVQEGEFVVVIGPSGAGKSTLLRTITGLTDVTGGTGVPELFVIELYRELTRSSS